MKKMINSFVVLVLVISSQKHYSKVFILQILKVFDRKVYCLLKKSKNKYTSPYSFLF